MHYFIWIYSHRIREFVIKFTIIRKIKNTKSKFIPQIDLMNYKISLKKKLFYSNLIFEFVIATWYTLTNRLEINWYQILNLTRNYYTHLDKLVLIASNAIRLRYFNHVGSRFESAECAYTVENHFQPEFEIKLLHSFITKFLNTIAT